MRDLQERANHMQRVARFSGNIAAKKEASRLQSAADRQRKAEKKARRAAKMR